MEPILTLDLAETPAKLRVVSYEGEKLHLWSETTVELIAPVHLNKSEELDSDQNAQSPAGSESRHPAKASTIDPSLIDPSLIDPSMYFVEQLGAAIKRLEPVWSSSAVLFAPQFYHSLNLELPFRDEKNVTKVLPLEAQDRLPFEVDEFLLEHKVLGSTPDNQYDIHVALTRKEELGQLLRNCQQAGLDPLAISTVASLLEGHILANPQAFSTNSALLSLHGNNAYLAFRVEGEFKSDRAIEFKSNNIDTLVTEIRRSFGFIEERYGKAPEELWLDDRSSRPVQSEQSEALPLSGFAEKLGNQLGEPLKLISSISLNASSSPSIVDWFALFCADGKAHKLFVNFRSGEFSQTLRWGALAKISQAALPYLGLFILTTIAILIAVYSSREQEIAHLRSGMIGKIRPILGDSVPASSLEPDKLIKTIQAANGNIEKQLKELGSPSKFSPLYVLSEVAKDFSTLKTTTITSVFISGTQLKITGTAKEYPDIDAIDAIFQSKRALYCRQDIGSSSLVFTLNITLCD